MRRVQLALLVPLLLLLAAPGVRAQERTVTVFAAASLKNALDEINQLYAGSTGTRVVTSYASSAALARQIEQGAPADLFISADVPWMDYVAERKLVRAESRVDLLGNSLVLISPKSAAVESQSIAPYFDLASLAKDGRIAVGDVRTVPVGRYAKAALEGLGIWASVEKRLAMAENVRAALALVARGETPLGIVYATDARVEPGVKVIGTFPDSSHPPIVYPAALTSASKPDAAAYLAFLRSGAARAVFERHGFTVRVTSAG